MSVSKKRYTCKYCPANFAGHSGLWYHMKTSHQAKTRTYHKKTDKNTVSENNLEDASQHNTAGKFENITRYSTLIVNQQKDNEKDILTIGGDFAYMDKPLKTMRDWVAARKTSWRRLRRRRFYRKKYDIKRAQSKIQ